MSNESIGKLTAEKFLRDKLESEIAAFGDGTTEFHTRDIQHLLHCLDNKDEQIKELKKNCIELMDKINFNAEEKFKNLLELCMTISNASAEQRLYAIRQEYKQVWDTINPKS